MVLISATPEALPARRSLPEMARKSSATCFHGPLNPFAETRPHPAQEGFCSFDTRIDEDNEVTVADRVGGVLLLRVASFVLNTSKRALSKVHGSSVTPRIPASGWVFLNTFNVALMVPDIRHRIRRVGVNVLLMVRTFSEQDSRRQLEFGSEARASFTRQEPPRPLCREKQRLSRISCLMASTIKLYQSVP